MPDIKLRAGETSPLLGAMRRKVYSPNKALINLGNGIAAFCRGRDHMVEGVKREVLMRENLEIFRVSQLLSANTPEMQEISASNGLWKTLKTISATAKNMHAKIDMITFIGVKGPGNELSAKGLDKAALFEKFTFLNPSIMATVEPFKEIHGRIVAQDNCSWFPSGLLEEALAQLSKNSPVVVPQSAQHIRTHESAPKTLKDVLMLLKTIKEEDKKQIINISMAVGAMVGEPYDGTPGIFITLAKPFGNTIEKRTLIVPLNLTCIDFEQVKFG